jgi:hypothetical protein
MGFVAGAWKKARQAGEPLKVTYILATEPGNKHEGEVIEVGERADVHGEEGNTVFIKVAINREDFDNRRPGATVTAKVHCGWAPIGYVWFHDLIAFVQTKILFRVF